MRRRRRDLAIHVFSVEAVAALLQGLNASVLRVPAAFFIGSENGMRKWGSPRDGLCYFCSQMTKAAGTGCMRPLENLLSGAACPIAFIEQHWLLEVKEQLQEKGVVMLTQGLAHPRSPLLDTELQQSKQTAMS